MVLNRKDSRKASKKTAIYQIKSTQRELRSGFVLELIKWLHDLASSVSASVGLINGSWLSRCSGRTSTRHKQTTERRGFWEVSGTFIEPRVWWELMWRQKHCWRNEPCDQPTARRSFPCYWLEMLLMRFRPERKSASISLWFRQKPLHSRDFSHHTGQQQPVESFPFYIFQLMISFLLSFCPSVLSWTAANVAETGDRSHIFTAHASRLSNIILAVFPPPHSALFLLTARMLRRCYSNFRASIVSFGSVL